MLKMNAEFPNLVKPLEVDIYLEKMDIGPLEDRLNDNHYITEITLKRLHNPYKYLMTEYEACCSAFCY